MNNSTIPRIDLNPNDWEEVKRILKTCVPEYDVWAFGSRVTWTAKEYSDLDLAIISTQPLTVSSFANLKELFEESTISFKVDVVDWSAIQDSFQKIIEKNKVIIQVGNASMSKWTFKRLIDCTIDGNLSYGIVQPGQHTENGIPIIRVNDFKNGRVIPDDLLKVSPEIEAKYLRTRLKGGEVLLTLVGSTGQSAIVPDEYAGWNIARAIAVIRPKAEIGAEWINICLQTSAVQQFLDERANTTVQKTLNLMDVREIPIPIPPKKTKEWIEGIAVALSDKIELNRRMNETLEAIARAIFKSWFVDFDPVRAKASGEAAESICRRLGLTPELLALFPNGFQDSELGEIPEGWEAKPFVDAINIIGGGTPKTAVDEYWNGEIPWFSVVDAPNETDIFVIRTEKRITIIGLENSSTRILAEGTTIITARGTVGKIALVGTPMAMNQSCYGIEGQDFGKYFTYFITQKIINILKQHSHGAVFDTITRNTFRSVQVIIPTKKVSNSFEHFIEPFLLSIKENLEQSLLLLEIRDTLLPKLISGELRVPNGIS